MYYRWLEIKGDMIRVYSGKKLLGEYDIVKANIKFITYNRSTSIVLKSMNKKKRQYELKCFSDSEIERLKNNLRQVKNRMN